MTPRGISGEDALIRAFDRLIDRADVHARGVVTGTGDDAAVIRGDGEDLVLTSDVLVEGRHFRRQWYGGVVLGRRAAAVNLSDIAAMGALPRYALVSLVIPADVPVPYVKAIERGIVEHFAEHGAAVVGGNVSATPGELVVDVTAVGACRRARAWKRAARANDAIVVVGRLGDAAMGHELLDVDPRARGALVNAFRRPVPRVDVARLLGGSPVVRAAIDVSDGFSTDLLRMCRAGGVGCRVQASALPVSRALRARCVVRGEDPLEWVMRGGEDYALILGVAPRKADEVCRLVRETLGVPVGIVGRFTPSKGVYQIQGHDGRAKRFRATGWDHFRTTEA
jgi:thiamine-monophosphate kinase